ncbi:hypothetical protein KIOSHI_252 [Bacillus phage Kioshi]|nr:hypothetical protein KIOSHI_252 [Bacillus phage Kioshi]
MRFFLFKLAGVLTIGAGGFVAGYSKGVSVWTVLGSIFFYFIGQLLYDQAFKSRKEDY